MKLGKVWGSTTRIKAPVLMKNIWHLWFYWFNDQSLWLILLLHTIPNHSQVHCMPDFVVLFEALSILPLRLELVLPLTLMGLYWILSKVAFPRQSKQGFFPRLSKQEFGIKWEIGWVNGTLSVFFWLPVWTSKVVYLACNACQKCLCREWVRGNQCAVNSGTIHGSVTLATRALKGWIIKKGMIWMNV